MSRLHQIVLGVGLLLTSWWSAQAQVATPDFVVTARDDGYVYVAQWSPDANAFAPLARLGYAGGDRVRATAIGDFDEDGDLDIAVGGDTSWSRNQVTVFANDGTNQFPTSFLAAAQDATGSYDRWAMDMTTGDFNHDGHLDLAVSYNTGTMSIFLGNGMGHFTSTIMRGISQNGRGLDTADFNHDGHLDLVRGCNSDGWIRYFPGNGDGTFGVAVELADIGDDNYGTTAGDFDGDGHDDIIANSGGGGDPYFFKGNGDGTFVAPVYIASLDTNTHGAYDAYDYDGDGVLDVVICAHNGSSPVYFCRGTGVVSGLPTFAAGVSLGNLGNYSMAISAPPLPAAAGTPEPALTATAATIPVGQVITFTGSASSDPDGTLASYTLDYGDGTSAASGAGAPGNFGHTYLDEGVFTAKLKVTDNASKSAYAVLTVTVLGDVPSLNSAGRSYTETTARWNDWPLLPDGLDGGPQWPLLLDASSFAADSEGPFTATWSFPDDTFTLDFEDGSVADWQAYAGTWTVNTATPLAGAISLAQTNSAVGRTYFYLNRNLDRRGQDFSYGFTFRMTAGGGEEVQQLLSGFNDLFSYEIIWRGRGYDDLLVRRYYRDSYQDLLNVPLNKALDLNQTYQVRVDVRGSSMAFYLDGRYLGQCSQFSYPVGRVGVSTYNSAVLVDDLYVTTATSVRVNPAETFSDNFEDGDAAGWVATSGTWTVTTDNPVAGTYSLRQSGYVDRALITYPTVLTGDYTFAVTARPVANYEHVILRYNIVDGSNYHEALYRGNGNNDLLVRRIVNGSYTDILNVGLPRPFVNGGTYRLMITRRGDIYDFYLDGQFLYSVTDQTTNGGKVGLSNYYSECWWDDVAVTPGVVRHVFPAGVNQVGLAVTDGGGQTITATIPFTMTPGVAPIAQAGGPYAADELTGTVAFGGWSFPLTAGATTDDQTPTGSLVYAWDQGPATFDGTVLDPGQWVYSTGVTQNNEVAVSNTDYSWGTRYFTSRATYPRAAGTAFEARVKTTSGNIMLGWKDNSEGYSYYYYPYCFYFDNGVLRVYEGSSGRGGVANYSYNTWYRIRIELLPNAGARYYWKPDNDAAPWELLYSSWYSTATDLRFGYDVYLGTFTIDDLTLYSGGVAPAFRAYAQGAAVLPITLTVADLAGQRATAVTTLETQLNQPPVAAAGDDVTLVENDAMDKVWTVNFNGGASTDDYGIWTYEWDWSYDGNTFTPDATDYYQTHEWTEAGNYTVALRVTDHAHQTHVDTLAVSITSGNPPTAVPGGPYAFNEFTGNALAGAWQVALNGAASSDAESSVVQYVWNLGVDEFPGTVVNTAKWVYGLNTVQNEQVTITRPGSGGADYYFVSTDTYTRVRGQRLQWRMKGPSSNDTLFGFKTDDTDYNWGQWVYAVAMVEGNLRIYQSGSGYSTDYTYAADTWYDFMIELKESRGARYYYKAIDAAEWTLLYDTDHSYDTAFRRGLHVYRGSASIDKVVDHAAGPTPTYRHYGPAGAHPVSLTVTDQALQTHTAATTVTLGVNQPPVANAGPDLIGTESNAVDHTWTFTFFGGASTDDHGIYRYEWDWSYDAGDGFQPSGDTGVSRLHQFDAVGTYTVAVRVFDHLMQSSMDTCTVTITIGDEPTAEAGPDIVSEVGWAAQFNGGGSADDVGIAHYRWDFGDGTHGVGRTPTHIYTALGTYSVELTVADSAGQTSQADTLTVSVITSTVPFADAGGPYTGGPGGPPVFFNGGGSSDAGAPGVQQGVVQYRWDVDTAVDSSGDSVTDNDLDAVGLRPFYTYAAAGSYTAKLTVVDGAGQSASDTATVTITSGTLHQVVCVPWRGDPNQPHPAIDGQRVRLKGIVRGPGTLRYQWDFGDGSALSPATPTVIGNKLIIEAAHIYTGSVGKPYNATLMVWDANDNLVTDTYSLRIEPDTQNTRANMAIDEGLWYLHKGQNKTSGLWSGGYSSYYSSSDSGPLQAFAINGHRPQGNPAEDPYVETVQLGFKDLFSRIRGRAIGVKPPGDPDTNGNGIGLETNNYDAPYELGQVMDAIAATQAPFYLASSGPAEVKGRTFHSILTDMVDMYAWGQEHRGYSGRGGWRYDWQSSSSDNSAAQWGAIGLLAAEDTFGIYVPEWVRTENMIWLNYSYYNGTFGYSDPNYFAWGWHATTASGLVQYAFNKQTTATDKWRAAEANLAADWPLGESYNRNYYSYYALTKAMRLAYPAPVTQFYSNSFDWYGDPVSGVRAKLINEQNQVARDNGDGYWYGYAQDGNGYGLGYHLSTGWAVIMLTSSLFVQPPVAVITAPTVWGYGAPLAFSATGSYHPDPERHLVKYEWDFNNDGVFDFTTDNPSAAGATFTWADPSPDPGDPPMDATVRLRVTDDNTPPQTDTTQIHIIIAEPPHAPYARITGPATVTQNLPTVFDGAGSFDIDPSDFITLYEWDFNNDGWTDAAGTSLTQVVHAFPTLGRASIALRVTDNGVFHEGVPLVSEWYYFEVLVEGNYPPVADPGGPYQVYAHEPLLLDGGDSSDLNGDPLTFAWDLQHDGLAEGTAETFSHTWTEAGNYLVWLTVSDGLLEDQWTALVQVLPNHLLIVQTTPLTGLPIAGTPSGTTDYATRVHDQNSISLTAPGAVANGDSDYHFSQWWVNGVAVTPAAPLLSMVMTTPITATAQFVPVARPLTVTSTPISDVSITGTPAGSTPYASSRDDNSQVSLDAPLGVTRGEADYRFVRWRKDGIDQAAGVSTLAFAINAATAVTAVFEPVPRVLTVSASPVTGVAITGTHPGTTAYVRTLDDDTAVSLTAPTETFYAHVMYTFVQWQVNGVDWTPGEQTLAFHLQQNTTVNAVYREMFSSLTVTLWPPQAVALGAKWRLDDGPWQDSGTTLDEVHPGFYTVSFSAIPGWWTPDDQELDVMAGQTTAALGIYRAPRATRAGALSAWGHDDDGQATVPEGSDYVAVAAGDSHSLALRSDGSLAGWGLDTNGQATPPEGNDFLAIAAGASHSLALVSDGSIAMWGDEDFDQQNDLPFATDFVAIAAGFYHSVGLRSDGSLVVWGSVGWPPLPSVTTPEGHDFIAIAAGGDHCLALRLDGSLVGWGDNFDGQSDVPAGHDFVAIAAGENFSVALRQDGSIVAWGDGDYDQLVVPAGTGYASIAGGGLHGLALDAVGVLTAWGDNTFEQLAVPEDTRFLAMAAGLYHSVAVQVPAFELNIESEPPTGVAITAVPASLGGHTTYSATVPQYTSISLTAPAAAATGNQDYTFLRWVIGEAPWTPGELTASFVLMAETGAVAEYEKTPRQLVVTSSPVAGLAITGTHPGSTSYTETIADHTAVSLTAPAATSVGDLDYQFSHWLLGGVQQPAGTTLGFTLEANVTATAVYVPVPRQLTVSSTPVAGLAITGTHPGTTSYTATIADHTSVSLTAPAATSDGDLDYQFSYWLLGGVQQSAGTTLAFAIEASATATAVYVPVPRQLTVSATPVAGLAIAGTHPGSTTYTATIADDSAVSLTAPATASAGHLDYQFSHWLLDGDEQPAGTTLEFTIEEDGTATAVYVLVPRQLAVSSTPMTDLAIGGTHPGITEYEATIGDGTTVTLTAPATAAIGEEDYTFVRWEIGEQDWTPGMVTATFALEADTEAVAEYVVTPRQLTVSSSPIADVAIDGNWPGTTPYVAVAGDDSEVLLTAPFTATSAGKTYVFRHWLLNSVAQDEEELELSLTIGANTTAVAVYQLLVPPTLTVDPVVVVTEGTAFVTIRATITGATYEPIWLDYETADVTALDGEDYEGDFGTFEWEPWTSGTQTFVVALLDDEDPEVPETFTVTFTGSHGLSAQTVVQINDNDRSTHLLYDVTLAGSQLGLGGKAKVKGTGYLLIDPDYRRVTCLYNLEVGSREEGRIERWHEAALYLAPIATSAKASDLHLASQWLPVDETVGGDWRRLEGKLTANTKIGTGRNLPVAKTLKGLALLITGDDETAQTYAELTFSARFNAKKTIVLNDAGSPHELVVTNLANELGIIQGSGIASAPPGPRVRPATVDDPIEVHRLTLKTELSQNGTVTKVTYGGFFIQDPADGTLAIIQTWTVKSGANRGKFLRWQYLSDYEPYLFFGYNEAKKSYRAFALASGYDFQGFPVENGYTAFGTSVLKDGVWVAGLKATPVKRAVASAYAGETLRVGDFEEDEADFVEVGDLSTRLDQKLTREANDNDETVGDTLDRLIQQLIDDEDYEEVD